MVNNVPKVPGLEKGTEHQDTWVLVLLLPLIHSVTWVSHGMPGGLNPLLSKSSDANILGGWEGYLQSICQVPGIQVFHQFN